MATNQSTSVLIISGPLVGTVVDVPNVEAPFKVVDTDNAPACLCADADLSKATLSTVLYLVDKVSYRNKVYHIAWRSCWSGQQGPFCELINFSDAEGIIGASVSAELAKDFAEFQERAASFDWQHPHFKELYQQWREAFELASDNGAVRFH